MIISERFRDGVRVYMFSQIALLIFQNLKQAMKSAAVQQVLLNCVSGAMMVLR
jgi:hypothetical protein